MATPLHSKKLSQDHLELLFSKIMEDMAGTNPNVLEFKWALRRISLQNSIEPAKTGNCTKFEDSMSSFSRIIDFPVSIKNVAKTKFSAGQSSNTTWEKSMWICQIDNSKSDLMDNILHYITWCIVK